VLLLVFVPVSSGAHPPLRFEQLASAPLRDQRGATHRFVEQRGAPVVVLVVTARRLRQAKEWEVQLRRAHAELPFVRVGDVPAAPKTTYDKVASRLRGRVPEDVAVLIDVERSWARAFELDTEEVNALVFDRELRLVARVRGPRTTAKVAELSKAITGLSSPDGASAPAGRRTP